MQKDKFLLGGLLILMPLLMMTQPAFAAKRLGPPIEQLQGEPERIRIVVAKAGEKSEPNSIKFAITERLSGEAPETVVLRTDPESFVDVEAGQSYIVAWSYLRRNRRVKSGWDEDPAGPFMVEILGLGSTALFIDTPELRFLFSPAARAEADSPEKQLDALLAQTQREDYRSRGLVISELYLRPDLVKIMGPTQAEALMAVLQKQELDPQHRDLLFRVALDVAPNLTSPWLAEEFRKAIILHGTQYDLRSFVPALVRTAAWGLQQTGTASDVDMLSTLLYSNSPGVSKAALDAINQLDAKSAVVKAQQAMERGWINSETRRELTIYLSKAGVQTQ